MYFLPPFLVDYSTLPQRLKNSLIASGETQIQFAAECGVRHSSLTHFLCKYRGLRKGPVAKKVVAEMKRRGWLNSETTGFAIRPVKTTKDKPVKKDSMLQEVLRSNMTAENKIEVLSALYL